MSKSKKVGVGIGVGVGSAEAREDLKRCQVSEHVRRLELERAEETARHAAAAIAAGDLTEEAWKENQEAQRARDRQLAYLEVSTRHRTEAEAVLAVAEREEQAARLPNLRETASYAHWLQDLEPHFARLFRLREQAAAEIESIAAKTAAAGEALTVLHAVEQSLGLPTSAMGPAPTLSKAMAILLRRNQQSADANQEGEDPGLWLRAVSREDIFRYVLSAYNAPLTHATGLTREQEIDILLAGESLGDAVRALNPPPVPDEQNAPSQHVYGSPSSFITESRTLPMNGESN